MAFKRQPWQGISISGNAGSASRLAVTDTQEISDFACEGKLTQVKVTIFEAVNLRSSIE
jgi:hypothetical protein